jgi:hypothetical protein
MFILSLQVNISYVIKLVLLLTEPNTADSKYSSVIKLRSMRITIAAEELNGLCLMVGDIFCLYRDFHP